MRRIRTGGRSPSSMLVSQEAANDGPWLDVPPDNILRRENLLGDAVACVVAGEVRCFIAPNET